MTSRLVSWKEKNLSTLGAVASILYEVSSAKVGRTYHDLLLYLCLCARSQGMDRDYCRDWDSCVLFAVTIVPGVKYEMHIK